MEPVRIGIDLGTTFSVIAYLDELSSPTIVPNSEGKDLTPSVVLYDGDKSFVGDIACNQIFARQNDIVQFIKRSMGDDGYRFKERTPTQISADILRKLKADAESHFGSPVSEAVITVPAYFGDPQRRATKEAGELAGLRVLDLPNEPTAAALYYGAQKLKDAERVLVFDLGGGTFDATVLLHENDNFRVLATDGSRELGGLNWTQALAEQVEHKFKELFGVDAYEDPRMVENIFQESEKAKRNLSHLDATDIPLSFNGRVEAVKITLDEFDTATRPLLLQAMGKVDDALRKASLGWSGIHQILLVGGSTRLRQVSRSLEEACGKKPVLFRNVDTIVALGAALYTKQVVQSDGKRRIAMRQPGGKISVKTLQEVTSFGLGTVVEKKVDGRIELRTSVILKPQSPIPAEQSRKGYRTAPNQQQIEIPVLQVDEDDLDPRECALRVAYRFTGIPARATASEIEVRFRYDKDAIIDVDAMDMESGALLRKEPIPFSYPETTDATVPEVPSIMLILDTSGSMAPRMREAQSETQKVCDQLSVAVPVPRLGLVLFGGNARLACGLSDNIAKTRNGVLGASAGGGTPMAEAIALARSELQSASNPRYAILVSDGAPNDENAAIMEATAIKRDGAVLYTISIGNEGGEFLRRIGDGFQKIDSVGGLSGAISNLLKID